eukprot:CAMPEP_0184487086 /NCGR_PEP_ID=MMETSP0113_2-20130426/9186_1 /TAXON_ID=91329 /ORGANISM="Norrisiella sphaerica, Strain BC52" /LENGTH=145 /DNA_ID=CAMNT_0026869255 /DNA_START=174 /DNA_END=608 /DNA_ORIENTATION=-
MKSYAATIRKAGVEAKGEASNTVDEIRTDFPPSTHKKHRMIKAGMVVLACTAAFLVLLVAWTTTHTKDEREIMDFNPLAPIEGFFGMIWGIMCAVGGFFLSVFHFFWGMMVFAALAVWHFFAMVFTAIGHFFLWIFLGIEHFFIW